MSINLNKLSIKYQSHPSREKSTHSGKKYAHVITLLNNNLIIEYEKNCRLQNPISFQKANLFGLIFVR